MSEKAQERLEKLRSKLKASVAVKQENVATSKTSGVPTRNKGVAGRAQAPEKSKKVHESLTQINAQAPDKKILDLVSQKRREIHTIKPHHQVPEKKTHESFTEMRLKRALAKAPNVSKSAGTHASKPLEKPSAEYRLRKLKRKSSQRDSESDRSLSQKQLSAVLPETKSVGCPQQVLRNPDFKIPKTSAAAKSSGRPSSLYNSSESLKSATDIVPAASKITPNRISNFENSAVKQNLAGILRNIRPSLGRLESTKTISDLQNVGSNEKTNQLTRAQNDHRSHIVTPYQDTSVDAQKNRTERNMYKRKAPGSAKDFDFEAARTQLRSRVDRTQSSHGLADESNEKQQRNDRPSLSVKPSRHYALDVTQKNPVERKTILKRKESSSSIELPSESPTQLWLYSQIDGKILGLSRESNPEQQQQPKPLLSPSKFNPSVVAQNNSNLQRNLFKRKAPGPVADLNAESAQNQRSHQALISSQTSRTFPLGSSTAEQQTSLQNAHKLKHESGGGSRDIKSIEGHVGQIDGKSLGLSRESIPEQQQQPKPLLNPFKLNSSVVAQNNSNLQRNLFKRKAPGPVPDLNAESAQNQRSHQALISSQTSRTFPLGSSTADQQTSLQNAHKPKHESGGGLRGIVSRAYKGVVSAVKETSYYCSRSEVSKELQTVRRTVEPVEAMDYEITSATFEDEQTPLVQSDLYLVVDTNVAIDNLALIKSFKTRKVKGMTPKVIVPWQVLKELDYLKEGKNRMDAIISRARKGIHYLVDEMCKYGGFISGQPQKAALRELEDFRVEVPDDHLIKCCLQLKNNGHNVMLLTNDKNLVIKGVVSGVPSMKCVDFIENCPENEAAQPLSPFEAPPTGTFDPDLLPIANAAHQMAVLLKNFLNAVLKKFLKYRFQELWKLRIPGEEPWSLTVLLETIVDYWHEIASKYGASTDVKNTLLFLRRFIHKVAYDRLRYAEVDQFARSCHQLAVALPPSFGVEGVCFDNRLAFWKCPPGTDPPADITFSRSCVNFTIHHMQLFENNLVQYCFSVSKTLGVPFSHPKISLCCPGVVDLNIMPEVISTVKIMGEALSKISSIPLGSVVKSSDGVMALHSSLVTSLGDAADMRFFVEDVIEFCNCSEIRHLFPDALQSLEVVASFLNSSLEGHRNFTQSTRQHLVF